MPFLAICWSSNITLWSSWHQIWVLKKKMCGLLYCCKTIVLDLFSEIPWGNQDYLFWSNDKCIKSTLHVRKTPLKVNAGLTFSLLRLLFSSPIFPRSPFSEGLTAPANLTYWDTVYTNSYSSSTDITCMEATVDWFDQALQALTKIMNQHSNITCIYILFAFRLSLFTILSISAWCFQWDCCNNKIDNIFTTKFSKSHESQFSAMWISHPPG